MTNKTEQSLIFSQDGSHSVFSTKYNASYHSIFGAIEESIHVFISAGLYYLFKSGLKSISVFEMGFGTGLNALLTLLESERLGLHIQYETIESDPLSSHLLDQLNYSELLACDPTLFYNLHACKWESAQKISDQFLLFKQQGKLQEILFTSKYDLIYFDAFAPSCQAELWSKEIHRKIFDQLNPGGVLVTYCTQGAFKRNLKEIGYRLEVLNGPGKKREMLRAIKS